MALRDQPYLPLYIQDYLTDEKLNNCTASTQGVYIKIMCIFHKSLIYGGVLLKQKDKQKSSMTSNFVCKLARLLPFDEKTVAEALTELLEEEVLKIDGDFLFQKRMVHDNKVSEARSRAGAKGGGNPSFVSKLVKTKSQTKDKQNTEYENEIEYDNKIDLNNKKGVGKKSKWEPDHVLKEMIISKFPTISALSEPSAQECEEILTNYTKEAILEVLEAMENHKELLKKYKSFKLTATAWLKRRTEYARKDKLTPNQRDELRASFRLVW